MDEVGLIVITDAVGHIGERQCGLVEQMDDLTETDKAYKLAWGEAGVLAECPFELAFTERDRA